jgi:cytochrome c oxidase cbb3-type subunit 2
MSTGLSGTPMPTYRDSLPEQDRWALAYYVLSLSSFKDPLTGEPLPISAADRAALNDPKLEAGSPDDAYVPSGGTTHRAAASGATLAATPQKEE